MIQSDISAALIKCLVKNGEKTIAQAELEDILNKDIHDTSLGCKISNTHIRIGKVHLDTFYEAQLLFGNAYWTDVFSFYFYNFIIKTIEARTDFDKAQAIILYGYETYSTLTLNKTLALLEKAGYNAYLRVFEVKYNRVRYCDEDIKGHTADDVLFVQNPIVFFFMGISSTLSTFKHMNKALNSINDKYKKVEKYCTSIIQVVGNENDASNQFISIGKDQLGSYAKCLFRENYLEFIEGIEKQKAYYYVSVKATWYIPQNCKLCKPSNYLNEYPLIEVNESSVVPTQMIRLEKTETKQEILDPTISLSPKNTNDFLSNLENHKYLHYGHIERAGNHFQYYFRLSRLYHDQKKKIEQWLVDIKKYYKFNHDRTINIIVAPQHYSNTGFINSINNIIFDGTAHIMEFDIHKEYRSNFKAKYNNYSELEKMINELNDYTVNFYYVNDQIVSGSAFYRTKSLIKSLFSNTNSKFQIFRGIFVLLNRNSLDTRKNYLDVFENEIGGRLYSYLPYFSYLNLSIPSLRSYDDSCPICFNLNSFSRIINECALDNAVLHWQKKIISHRKMSVHEARSEKDDIQNSKKWFMRLQCENDLWTSVNNAYNQISNTSLDGKGINAKRDIIIQHFFECISLRLQDVKDENQVEYLIAYLKIISRALLYYQEDIKKACFYILLKIFEYFYNSKHSLNGRTSLVFSNSFPIGNNFLELNLNKKYLHPLRYDLFRVVISRLCSIGSCVLLDIDRLKTAREIGVCMQNETESKEGEFDDFLLHSIKKLLCFNKGDSKAIILQQLLEKQTVDNFYEDEFFLKLFLENLRRPALSKNEKTLHDLKSLKNEITAEKYKKLVDVLKNECGTSNRNLIDIQVFTYLGDSTTCKKITEGEIPAPTLKQDFFYDKENKVFYITIGNNFERLKDFLSCEQADFILENHLKIIRDAIIVLGIKTNDLENIAHILKYRKEIMEMVQADFNNDAIPRLITAQEQAKLLSEIKTVTHNSKPLQEFENVFNSLLRVKTELSLQRAFLSLYMDTVISIAYRESLRFNRYGFSTALEENSMFCLSYNRIGDQLDYAEKQINDLFGDEILLEMGKMYSNTFKPFDLEVQRELKDDFKKSALILRFRDSNEICECYMILKTLIDNAYKHCTNPKIWIRLVENENNGFDLLVENTVNDRITSVSDKGITLDALEYIFNQNSGADNKYFFRPDDKSKEISLQENLYQIKIKNFILIENEE